MKKRIVTLFVAASMLLTACGNDTKNEAKDLLASGQTAEPVQESTKESMKESVEESTEAFDGAEDRENTSGKPNVTEKPESVEKPAVSAKPTPTFTPAATEKPAETTKPAHSPAPATTEKPAESAKPAHSPTPAATEKPAESAKPAQTPEPAVTEAPVEEPKTEQPVETQEPEAPAQPSQPETPTQPEVPDQPPQPETPAHQHTWKDHVVTTQTWIPNIVVVEDYGEIPGEAYDYFICACGYETADASDIESHIIAHVDAGEFMNFGVQTRYKDPTYGVIGTHEEDQGYYESSSYVDYQYCDCGATN